MLKLALTLLLLHVLSPSEFQSQRGGKDRISNRMSSPNVRLSVKGGFPIIGQLHFEEGAKKSIVDIELRDVVGRDVIDRATSMPSGQFRFDGVTVGHYMITVRSERYHRVEESLIVDMKTFGMINLDIALYPRNFSSKSEALVSLEALRRSVPRKATEEYEKAVNELQKGNSKKAVERLKRALKIEPNFYDAHLQLGFAHQREERPTEAIVSLLEASKLNPTSAEARTWLGRLYFETDQMQKAVAVLSERISLGAVSSDDFFFLGSAHYRLGELAEAEENLLQAAGMTEESSGQARLQLFNVYMRSGRPIKALGQLEAYLNAFPDSPNYDAIKDRVDQIRKDLGSPG